MSEKTEQPTPKRLRDARQKGQVTKSREIVTTATILGIFILIWAGWGYIMRNLKELVLVPTVYYDKMPFEDALSQVLEGVFIKYLAISIPVVFCVIASGILSNMLQIGVLFASEPIKPDLKKIDPAQGLKKIFSLNNIIELVKSVIKIVVLGYIIQMIIKDSIDMLLKMPHLGLQGILPTLSAILKKIVIYGSAAFIVVSILDFFFQRYQHIKKLKMSKDEVKREYKEMEGDPHIKSKRRQLHREMAMNDTIQRARKASVIVTNPTHLAIALFYEKEETKLPVILAKGEDLLAKRIIEVAQEEGIPIMQNVPLAQDLYKYGSIDEYIPSDLIKPVAEVLRWVQQLKKNESP